MTGSKFQAKASAKTARVAKVGTLSSLSKFSKIKKGIGGAGTSANGNAFDTRKNGKEKFSVLNRKVKGASRDMTQSSSRTATARKPLITEYRDRNKRNAFKDGRFGENDESMEHDEKMMKRFTQQKLNESRAGKKKKPNMFNLDESTASKATFTHGGKVITSDYTPGKDDHLTFDDAEDDPFNALDKVETEMHFGGGRASKADANPYGPTKSSSLGDQYRSRKTELDDVIKQSKLHRAEKAQEKEEQKEVFTGVDEAFDDLRNLLEFRDKKADNQAERQRQKEVAKKITVAKDLDSDDDDWDYHTRVFNFEARAKATDRTKSAEEIAKEEREKLEEQESRRLKRMNGDFDDDDLDDVDPKKKKKISARRTGDELSDSEEEENDDPDVAFMEDGLKYIDKQGRVVGDYKADDESTVPDSDDELEALHNTVKEESDEIFPDTPVEANYQASMQFSGKKTWYKGKVVDSRVDKNTGLTVYDVEYEDGDFEGNLDRSDIRRLASEEEEAIVSKKEELMATKEKRKRAKQQALTAMPFMFSAPPTTQEALEDLVGEHCKTGADVSLLLDRIHKSNCVRLDKRNSTGMGNFADVLLRRYVQVADALEEDGDSDKIARKAQLVHLNKILFRMAGDDASSIAAVYKRRIGVIHRQLLKKLNDTSLVVRPDGTTLSAADADFSAWPSYGTILLLRNVSHCFPVTDASHAVVTPALLCMGQCLTSCAVRNVKDLIKGLMLAKIMFEATAGDKNYKTGQRRIAPEAVAFVSSALRLFSGNAQIDAYEVESVGVASKSVHLKPAMLKAGRECYCVMDLAGMSDVDEEELCGQAVFMGVDLALTMANVWGVEEGMVELFATMTKSALLLVKGCKQDKVRELVEVLGGLRPESREPLQLRKRATAAESMVVSLAPRVGEEGKKYDMGKDKGKEKSKAEMDKMQREYKRQKKAAARELRLDGQHIERARREDEGKKRDAAKAERNKNFAWLEGEQATMNQQIREGGGLMKGGGVGAARAKARTGKVGIKKGGKMRN